MNRLYWKRLIGSLAVALISLQLSRLVFYLNLSEYFDSASTEIAKAFAVGIRFDAVSIAYGLGWFVLLIPFLDTNRYRSSLIWLFLVILGGMNLLNCIDAEFFKFTARRSTIDLFEFAFLSNDLFNIAPNLIGHFWYLLVAFLLISTLTVLAILLLFKPPNSAKIAAIKPRNYVILTAVLLVFMARGGFSGIPLSIVDASTVNPPHLNSVALSTPFTILKTIGKPHLPLFKFPEEEISDFNPIQQHFFEDTADFKGNNVVLLIVESLSAEYIGYLNGLNTSYTPFIDSLFERSLVYENAFANGHRSIEGIAAIIASIPTLMYEPFTTSHYAENEINSLGSLMGEIGYHTSFIHGGNKNSMNFESFSRQAGINVFIDRDDYPFPNKHYDGIWGISDHFMLQECVRQFDSYPKPFFSTVFTLSSHHPYTIPNGYQNRFPKGTLPIHESIGYADQSLKEFFEVASQTDWYTNTLFIITADHTSLSEHDKFQTKVGSFRIPVALFYPDKDLLVGRTKKNIQQTDLMPTVLDLVGYQDPYFSFGNSALDTNDTGFAVAFKHDQYQLLRNNQVVCFDGEKVTFVYDLMKDPLLKKNLVSDTTIDFQENEAFLKRYIQNYSVALNYNTMTYESWSSSQK